LTVCNVCVCFVVTLLYIFLMIFYVYKRKDEVACAW